MNERIRELRKTLKLNQGEFGNRIGITGSGVSRIESGSNNTAERTIKSICKEFNVDYMWLTTGNGKMFIDTEEGIISAIERIMAGGNEFHKNLFKTFAVLDADELLALERILGKFIEAGKKKGDDIFQSPSF